MACTPRKLVHWSADNEVNEFVYGSPYSDASSSDSINATSTLQYINSQLTAHGFARGAGISMEGLTKEDTEKLTKCLLAMLSQRVEDISRTEDLSTKLRTLSYEHERLSSMHRTTEEQLASAERETNLFKSRLSAANKATKASEAAFKASTADLQRTRTSLQSVRQTHAAELKRREKETEKMLERWQKIADAQTKLGATAAGLKFKLTHANPLAGSGSKDIDGVGGRGPDLFEDALEEAQMARKELIEENSGLKNVLLSTANEVARVARSVRQRLASSNCDDEQQQRQLTFTDIFSLPAPESASEKFSELLASFREAVNQTGKDDDFEPEAAQAPSPSQARKPKDESKEIQRLQNTVVDLRRQLEQVQTQKQSSNYSDQAQEIIRKFVNDDDDKAHVQERRVLEKIRKELDHARKKVDEAALTLRDEKEMLEEERQNFQRQQHLWRSKMGILHDGDEEQKPVTGLAAYFDAPAEPLDIPVVLASPKSTRKPKRAKSPTKSAAASPRKQLGKFKASSKKPGMGQGAGDRRARTTGRSAGPMLGASPARQRVIPPVETEVVPSPPQLLATAGSAQSLIVPNAFVLPPPTPLTSIPLEEDILSSLGRVAAPDFGAAVDGEGRNGSGEVRGTGSEGQGEPGPSKTKKKLPFPVAKPLAQRMIHAYSPARPSPLSRILLLSNSPSALSERLSEVDLEEFAGEAARSGSEREGGEGEEEPASAVPPAMTLDELVVGTGEGLSDDDDEDGNSDTTEESPLREKNIRLGKSKRSVKLPTTARGAGTLKDKLRSAAPGSKSAKRDLDKENGALRNRSGKTTAKPAAPAPAPTVKPLGAGKGGARRVPIGSVDAAPIGRTGWK